MWVSFLVAFLWARIWVTYFAKTPMVGIENAFEIGGRTAILGYHPHHIATGVLFLGIAGFVGLHYTGKVVTKIAAVLYGTGLGLIVDEIGIIVDGITYRNDFPEVFVLVVTISAWLMSTVYFPSFWKSVDARLARVYSRVAAWARSWQASETGPGAAPDSAVAANPAAPFPLEAPAPVPVADEG